LEKLPDILFKTVELVSNPIQNAEIEQSREDVKKLLEITTREVYPEAIIQRCLVHVQRQVFNYISRHPKSEAGKALVQIMRYATLSDPEHFIKVFEDWKKQHFHFLIEKSVSRKG
jgi:transposase-like protein